MNEYLSTVVKSGQVNTPPGSYLTIKEWARESFLGPHSNLLEIGCSTGFISIEFSRYAGAHCTGLDLHADSIKRAKSNVDPYVQHLVLFQQGDAARLTFDDNHFSHVVIGGHLPFVSKDVRHPHISEAVRVLKPWGYLLTALYYYHETPPQELIDRFNTRIGTQLDPGGNRSSWQSLFDRLPLTLEYEADYEVLPGDAEHVKTYIDQLSEDEAEKWPEILELFNENGRYLSYFVRVYRKYPSLPDLMLQVPRGGIYQVRQRMKTRR